MNFNTSLIDWANDTSILCDRKDDPCFSPAKFTASSNPQASVPARPFSIPSSLLAQASVERYGQITPPIDISPAELKRDSFLGDSFLIQQSQNKSPQLDDRNVQVLENSQSQQPDSQQLSHQDSPNWASGICRASKPVPINRRPSPPRPSSQSPKRKRGRPRAQPRVVEACTANSFPFQVSAARQSSLEKNRVAAHKCRMRKKEYIDGLECRARDYSSKNKVLRESVALLREEVLQLKSEVLRHARCGFWPVEEYLARCVDSLLDTKTVTGIIMPGKPNRTQSLAISAISPSKLMPAPNADLPTEQMTTDSQYEEDHSGLDLRENVEAKLESSGI